MLRLVLTILETDRAQAEITIEIQTWSNALFIWITSSTPIAQVKHKNLIKSLVTICMPFTPMFTCMHFLFFVSFTPVLWTIQAWFNYDYKNFKFTKLACLSSVFSSHISYPASPLLLVSRLLSSYHFAFFPYGLICKIFRNWYQVVWCFFIIPCSSSMKSIWLKTFDPCNHVH